MSTFRNQSKKRKYAEAWAALKQYKTVRLQVSRFEIYTPAQLERILKTMRKGMTKEKYEDWAYKTTNPNAEITSEFDRTTGTITFNLDPDTRDISKYFGF